MADTDEALRREVDALREALVYARERRGTRFDFDEWMRLGDAALKGERAPSALENEIAAHSATQAALATVRAALAAPQGPGDAAGEVEALRHDLARAIERGNNMEDRWGEAANERDEARRLLAEAEAEAEQAHLFRDLLATWRRDGEEYPATLLRLLKERGEARAEVERLRRDNATVRARLAEQGERMSLLAVEVAAVRGDREQAIAKRDGMVELARGLEKRDGEARAEVARLTERCAALCHGAGCAETTPQMEEK